MTVEEMRERKRELGYSYEQIAELSDVPVGTVQKVMGGITKSPRYDTLRALEEVFTKKTVGMVCEPQAAYMANEEPPLKNQGEYTLEDYYALPDERRVELIDGVIYDMSSPTHIHQLVGGQIFKVFMNYIDKKKGKCIPAYAPLDVQLDCDDKTMVQPDVLIVCDRDKFERGVVYGAPDLIVEIVSKSTKKKDMTVKLSKYSAAGVREYWVVDPDRRKVIVYDFENDMDVAVYGFENKVPVRIFGGECEVDFREIYEYVAFLYEKQ